MSEFSIYDNCREFERLLCEYTGAKYCIAVDNCCNALFLCLRWIRHNEGELQSISIPAHTYIGVPYAIKAAGTTPVGIPSDSQYLTGAYRLSPYPVWDSALHFTSGMYQQGQFMCLSFTGPYKHLKLGKAGAILLDDKEAETWIRKARFSGRSECSYHEDTFTMKEGYNMYLPAQTATLGAQLMLGVQKNNESLTLPYPDWTRHEAFGSTGNPAFQTNGLYAK